MTLDLRVRGAGAVDGSGAPRLNARAAWTCFPPGAAAACGNAAPGLWWDPKESGSFARGRRRAAFSPPAAGARTPDGATMADFALAIVAFAREEPFKFVAVFGALMFFRYGLVLKVTLNLRNIYGRKRDRKPGKRPGSGDENR